MTNSGKYKIHGYIDSNKEIKAIVLRKASVKQLQKMENFNKVDKLKRDFIYKGSEILKIFEV